MRNFNDEVNENTIPWTLTGMHEHWKLIPCHIEAKPEQQNLKLDEYSLPISIK